MNFYKKNLLFLIIYSVIDMKTSLIIDGDVAEIDLIDIFMVFGIVGVVSMYRFLLKRFYFKVNPQNFRYQPYIKFGVLLLIVLSCSRYLY